MNSGPEQRILTILLTHAHRTIHPGPGPDPAARIRADFITNYLTITGQGPQLATTAARRMAHQPLTTDDWRVLLALYTDRLTTHGHPPTPHAIDHLIRLMNTAVPPHLAHPGAAVKATTPTLATTAHAYGTHPANVILALAAAGPATKDTP